MTTAAALGSSVRLRRRWAEAGVTRVRHQGRRHLRRYSRAGTLVVSCTGTPIRERNAYLFANRVEASDCPDCLARAHRELEKEQGKTSRRKEVLI